MTIKEELKIVQEFINEKLIRDVSSFMRSKEIYFLYSQFCKEKNIKPISKVKLTYRLDYLGAGIKTTKTKNYERLHGRQGLRLK